MARARISLPVPLSPVMRTLTLVRAMRWAKIHQLAHVAGDDGAVAVDRQVLDRPEGRALLPLGAPAFEVVNGLEQQPY